MTDAWAVPGRAFVLAVLAAVATSCAVGDRARIDRTTATAEPVVSGEPSESSEPNESAAALVNAEAIVRALEPTRDRGLRMKEDGDDASGRISLAIQFASSNAAIDPASAPQLREIAHALDDPRLRSSQIEIAGHTDDRGAADANQRLSEDRAAAVKAALERDLASTTVVLTARGYGATHPLPGFPPSSPQGRAANRRVELVYHGAAPALRLDVRPERDDRGRTAALRAGDVLASGTSYRLTATPTVTCYVYVFQVDAAGHLYQLFPSLRFGTGDNPVAGRRTLRLPGRQDPWFELDDLVGRETIVALASETPLADAKQRAIAAANRRSTRDDGSDRGVLPGTFGDHEDPRPANDGAPTVFVWSLEFDHR